MQAALPTVIAGYPLLEALQTCRRQAMSGKPGHGRAPFNTIAHSTRQWTHSDRDFNTPTVDLLYSNAWLDLRHRPVVLEIPARSRFFVVELLDVYTNNFQNLGRLKPGATVERAQQQVDALNARNLERFPAMKPLLINAGFHTVVEPLQETLVRDVKATGPPAWLFRPT